MNKKIILVVPWIFVAVLVAYILSVRFSPDVTLNVVPEKGNTVHYSVGNNLGFEINFDTFPVGMSTTTIESTWPGGLDATEIVLGENETTIRVSSLRQENVCEIQNGNSFLKNYDGVSYQDFGLYPVDFCKSQPNFFEGPYDPNRNLNHVVSMPVDFDYATTQGDISFVVDQYLVQISGSTDYMKTIGESLVFTRRFQQ